MRKIYLLLVLLLILTQFSCTKSSFNALAHNIPSAYEYKRKGAKTLPLEKSITPFKFKEAGNNNLLKDKMLTFKNKTISVEDQLKKNYTQSFLVIRNDSILYENYFHKGGKNQISNVFSVSKSWTSLTLAIAVQKGYMDLEDPVQKYIPNLSKELKQITLRELIDMRTGIEYNETKGMTNPNSIISDMAYNKDIDKVMIKRTKSEIEPNIRFKYQSINTQLVSMAIEKATGQSFYDFFKINLWDVLGMETSGAWLVDNNNVVKSFFGLTISTRDNAKMGKLLLDGGVWQGKQLIPKWYVDQIVKIEKPRNGYYYSLSFRHNVRYIPIKEWDGKQPADGRYQKVKINKKIYVAIPFENDDFYADGMMGNHVYVFPKTNAIVVRHGNFALSQLTNKEWPFVYRAIADGSFKVEPYITFHEIIDELSN